MNKYTQLALGASLALIATACDQPTASSPTQGTTRVLVEYSLKPLMESEIAVFQQIYQQAKIEPVYVYDAELMALFLADSADLAITSHTLSEKELELIKKDKIWPQQLNVAKDGLALVVDVGFPFESISVDQLQAILLNKQGALPFHVVFDHEGSATVRFLEENVLNGTPLSKNCFAAESESSLLEHVKGNLTSIGIISVNNIIDKSDSTKVSFSKDIKILRLTGHDGKAAMPDQSAMFTGTYPLTRSITLYNREARSGLATGFAAFLASERGQRIVLREGLVPVTMPVRLVEITERPLN